MSQEINQIYLQLAALAQQWPEALWRTHDEPENRRLLAKIAVLIESAGYTADYVEFITAVQGLNRNETRTLDIHVATIETVFQRALARAELAADVTGQTHFIPSGQEFSATTSVRKIVSEAKESVRFVDPYAGIELLEQFAILCNEGIRVQVLADRRAMKSELPKSAEAWSNQYEDLRPLEIRLAMPRMLHDRVIFVDQEKVWVVGQSFNALATRAATTLVPILDDAAKIKIDAYEQIWDSAENPE